MSAECNALAGAASDGSVVGSHAVTYRLSGRPMRTTACRFRCVGQCLSRMRRKVQVRFLGEGAAATPLPYPTGGGRMNLLGGRYAPITDAIGFLEAEFAQVVAADTRWRTSLGGYGGRPVNGPL